VSPGMATTSPDLSARALPVLDDVNRPFWTGGRNGELLIQRCAGCGTWVHPPQPGPHACGGALEPTPVSGRGTVWTYTVNAHPWNPAVPLPYVVAVVELAEQADLRVVTNIVNAEPDAVRVGMPVQVLFEDHGEIRVPIFEPA
jgi:uncharacterized OB-fold protein